MRNGKGSIIGDTTETERITRDYYEQLHANNTDNLEETDKFLERYNLPRLSQKEKQNMNYTKYQN